MKRTATPHYTSRMIHDKANLHYRTPYQRSAHSLSTTDKTDDDQNGGNRVVITSGC